MLNNHNDHAKKKLSMLSKTISREVLNKLLAHAFIIVKRDGFILNVSSIDGEEFNRDENFFKELNDKRINVIVVKGLVKKSWIG